MHPERCLLWVGTLSRVALYNPSGLTCRVYWVTHAYVKTAGSCAGALLAVGILNCGLQHENDPAYALLHDFVDKQDPVVRIGAIMGLGLAYAGTQKEEVGPSISTIQAHCPVCTASSELVPPSLQEHVCS